MRRGQSRPIAADSADAGWSKQELMDAARISAKTFDTIRKSSRVRGPTHGGLNWLFTTPDLLAMIQRAESGRFTERGKPAAAGGRALLGQVAQAPGESINHGQG